MNLKSIRKLSGLSQQAFSKKYSIPRRSIENWETGKRVPPAYLLLLLERAVREDFQTDDNADTAQMNQTTKRSVMSRSTTRCKIQRQYTACRNCEYRTVESEKCNAGYENFYCRISKRNGCKRCEAEMKHYAVYGYNSLWILEEKLEKIKN